MYELGEHSQIPRLIAYFEQDKRLYLVQELIEGQNLLEELLSWNNFNFTMNSPVGHLPGALLFASLSSGYVRIGVGFLVSSLALRIEKCNIQ